MTLDGLEMFVSATAERSVVGAQTRIHFTQKGSRVIGRYAGGDIRRGVLSGHIVRDRLSFRYVQCEGSCAIHAGRSTCDVVRLSDGGVRIIEHFAWTTRAGAGTNIFDELPSTRRGT